jgi:hypothetical protein
MSRILQVSLSLILAAIVLFCIGGFLATFEPMPRTVQVTWRAVYGVAGLASVVGLIRVWRRSAT